MLTLRVVEEIDRLEPYGIGNPKPLLLAGQLEVVGQPRIVGDQQNHLQLRVRQGDVIMKAIGWNMAERGKALGPGTPCSLVFHPSINEWNNRREVQLESQGLRDRCPGRFTGAARDAGRDTDSLNRGSILMEGGRRPPGLAKGSRRHPRQGILP